MSRLDVFKSLLRSTARGVAEQLKNMPAADALRQSLGEATMRRTAVSDERMTAAVGAMSGVAAATVSSCDGRVRVEVSFDDGSSLALALAPRGVKFAPRGAKEVRFSVTPSAAADHGRCADVFSAIAGEIARTLWGPVLRRRAVGELSAFANRDKDLFSIDLRTVPEVREALTRPVTRNILDVIKLTALTVRDGHLGLSLAIEGMG